VSKRPGNSQIGVWLLIVIVALQAAALTAVSAVLLWATLTQRSESLSSAIALDVVVLIFAIAMVIVAIGVIRGKPAARSGAFVWQVLQMALGLASNDGSVFARPDIASALLIPAVAALLLILFNKGVRAHFADPHRDGDGGGEKEEKA
jgi:hypothetical protein